MAKIYKAYKLKTSMSETGMSVYDSAIEFIKKMFDYVSVNFSGFRKVVDWNYVELPSSDPLIRYYLLTAYFNLENANDKQILIYCLINRNDYGGGYYGYGVDAEIHVCQSDHTGTMRSNGIAVHNYRTFDTGDEWATDGGYEFYIYVYTDENGQVIGISATQASIYAYHGSDDSGVMLFDRTNGMAYTTRGFYSDGTAYGVLANGRWFAAYKGDDLTPKGQFVYSAKTQYSGIAVLEPILLKDYKDDFIKYKGDIDMISLGSVDLSGDSYQGSRYNQRILIGAMHYIHLDDRKLYLPISEFNEITISL